MKGIFWDVFSVVLGSGKRFVYQLEPLTISEDNNIYDGGLAVTKVSSYKLEVSCCNDVTDSRFLLKKPLLSNCC